jgi:NAD+ kinase
VTAVLLVPHRERADATALVREAAAWLRAHGHEGWVTPEDAETTGLHELAAERMIAEAGLAVSLGGDGTILRTVDLVDGREIPVLGVNVGVLGYLAEVEPDALASALTRFFADDYEIEERMLLEINLRRASGGDGLRRRALNEAVVEKLESGHTVRLVVSINGSAFTPYVADGLIVATPTGSTAYSMSARGPIVSPRLRAVLLTPVSPHMLFDRPLVLDPEEPLDIEVVGHRSAALSVDGQVVATLDDGDVLRCSAATSRARLVRFGERHFHQLLKHKFGLSDR